MKLALAQVAPATELTENARQAVGTLHDAARAGARLVCFPEIQLGPFFPREAGRDASRWLVDLRHQAVLSLREACRELGVAAAPNVYLREGGRGFDASLMIDDRGELLGVSKMVHVPQVPGFYEQDYYTPSEAGFRVYDTGRVRVGIVICFDRHYPESFRACALAGAQLVVIPTANVEGEDLELFEWELRVAAAQNGLFVAMCNRVGREGDATFAGRSVVVGPRGEVVARAGGGEELLLATVDLRDIEPARVERPYLDLRRPEVYGL